MSREKQERNLEIVRLKNAGVSFSDIGQQLGITRQMAQKTYKRIIQKMPLLK